MTQSHLERIEALERLALLHNEGALTDEEYASLKHEVVGSALAETERIDPAFAQGPASHNAEEEVRRPASYKSSLVLGVASVFFGPTFGLIPMAAIFVGLYAVLANSRRKYWAGRWMAWVGLGAGVIFMFVNAYFNGYLDSVI